MRAARLPPPGRKSNEPRAPRPRSTGSLPTTPNVRCKSGGPPNCPASFNQPPARALGLSQSLEPVIQTELDHTSAHAIRAGEHRRDLAEAGAIDVLVADVEIRVIEQVVKISPDLDALMLRQFGVLQQRHVVVVEPGTAQDTA